MCCQVLRLQNANFLVVSMTTRRDNEQALCGIFQFVLAATHPVRNSITITEEKYHRIVTHTVALKSLRPPA